MRIFFMYIKVLMVEQRDGGLGSTGEVVSTIISYEARMMLLSRRYSCYFTTFHTMHNIHYYPVL